MGEIAKLRLNLREGIIEVEGDSALVAKIYDDFKSQLASVSSDDEDAEGAPRGSSTVHDTEARASHRKSRKPRIAKASSGGGDKVSNYTPVLDKGLDTSKLSKFYEPFAPRNHAERVLIYARFLNDVLDISPCTGDQIFTCYKATRERVPEAFVQALRDASGGRYGYIDYKSPTEILSTTRGDNHFEHNGIKRKASE